MFITVFLLLKISEIYSQEYGTVSGIITNQGEREVSVLVSAISFEMDQLTRIIQFTDKNGRYNIQLEVGEYEISAYDEDGRSITKFINIKTNTNTHIDFLF